jgi:hypothetical protein
MRLSLYMYFARGDAYRENILEEVTFFRCRLYQSLTPAITERYVKINHFYSSLSFLFVTGKEPAYISLRERGDGDPVSTKEMSLGFFYSIISLCDDVQ